MEITTVADKGITAETFEKQCQARIDSVKNDLITLANEIKGNSSSMFSTLATAITKGKTIGMTDEEILETVKIILDEL